MSGPTDAQGPSRSTDGVPAACTLPTAEQPGRVAELDELLSTAVVRAERVDPGTLRLVLRPESVERAREMTERESRCCSFFGFDFAPDDEGDGSDGDVALTITVPAEHTGVLDALEGRPDVAAGRPSSSDAG